MSDRTRRRFLKATGGAAVLGTLAGCSGDGGGGSGGSLDRVGMSAYVRGGSWARSSPTRPAWRNSTN